MTTRIRTLVCSSTRIILAGVTAVRSCHDRTAVRDGRRARAYRPGQARSNRSRRHAAVHRRQRCRPPPATSRSLGCVSGPDHGAMGIHYVNGRSGGRRRDRCHAAGSADLRAVGGRLATGGRRVHRGRRDLAGEHHAAPPVLEGQSFQFVGSPNRYGLAAPFFELHVWAWRDNPNGAFVDWNNHVTCEGQ